MTWKGHGTNGSIMGLRWGNPPQKEHGTSGSIMEWRWSPLPWCEQTENITSRRTSYAGDNNYSQQLTKIETFPEDKICLNFFFFLRIGKNLSWRAHLYGESWIRFCTVKSLVQTAGTTNFLDLPVKFKLISVYH